MARLFDIEIKTGPETWAYYTGPADCKDISKAIKKIAKEKPLNKFRKVRACKF